MTNIAVFASGSGTNAVNLVNTFNSGSRIRVAICLVDRQNAPVIQKMEALGVAVAYYPRSVWRTEPEVILDVLRDNDIRVIALAGFLSIVSEKIVRAYEGRILNIHPSLLPAFGGDGMWGGNVHQAVLDAGASQSGATVHIVTEEVDKGPIVLQKAVPVLPDDTAETLEMRVHEVEYEIFPQAVVRLLAQLGDNGNHHEDINDTPLDVETETDASQKSVDDDWAEALGVPNNVPPVPGAECPPLPKGGNTQNADPRPWMQSHANRVYSAPAARAEERREPMPQTYLIWSVLATVLCCFIPGVIGIIMSSKVSSRYYAGDLEGARRASRNAEIWIIISFVLGVISSTLYLPLTIAGWL